MYKDLDGAAAGSQDLIKYNYISDSPDVPVETAQQYGEEEWLEQGSYCTLESAGDSGAKAKVAGSTESSPRLVAVPEGGEEEVDENAVGLLEEWTMTAAETVGQSEIDDYLQSQEPFSTYDNQLQGHGWVDDSGTTEMWGEETSSKDVVSEEQQPLIEGEQAAVGYGDETVCNREKGGDTTNKPSRDEYRYYYYDSGQGGEVAVAPDGWRQDSQDQEWFVQGLATGDCLYPVAPDTSTYGLEAVENM